MARQHKTMRGKAVNMDTLRIQNEKVIALGNMNVNAGGDELGPGGVIIKDRNQRIKDEKALHTMVPTKVPVIKNQADLERKTAANSAAKIEADAAEQALADADASAGVEKPKGGLAASLAETPKKKTTTKKK